MMILNCLQRTCSALISMAMILVGSMFPDYSSQQATLSTLTKVNDYLYVMDYQYDYDVDEMAERGQFNRIDLILHNALKLVAGDRPGFACTTFNAVTESGEYIMGRNFDYMPSTVLLVWTHPDNAYASMGMVNLEMLLYSEDFQPDTEINSLLALLAPHACADGINEKGLSIGILELETSPTYQITGKTSITTTGIIRLCLDKAATVEEAVALFSNYDMRDAISEECSYHYQICDANGDSAIVEYVENEMKVIYPEKNSGDSIAYQAATNYILSYNNGVWDSERDPDGMGIDRYDYVMETLGQTGGVLSCDKALQILDDCSAYQEDMNGYICDTLWSALYHNTTCSLDLVVGLDYDNPITFSVNEPCKILN